MSTPYASPSDPALRPDGRVGVVGLLFVVLPLAAVASGVGLAVPVGAAAVLDALGIPGLVGLALALGLMVWVWRGIWGIADVLARGDWRLDRALLRSLDPRELGGFGLISAMAGAGLVGSLFTCAVLTQLARQVLPGPAVLLVGPVLWLSGSVVLGLLWLLLGVAVAKDSWSRRLSRLRALDRFAVAGAALVSFTWVFVPLFLLNVVTLVAPELLEPWLTTPAGKLGIVGLLWLWVGLPAAPMCWLAEGAWSRRSSPAGRHRCPCCGHPTLLDRAAHEICAGCGWQDDGQDDDDAGDVRGGPNGDYSLAEARENVRATGSMYRRGDPRFGKP